MYNSRVNPKGNYGLWVIKRHPLSSPPANVSLWRKMLIMDESVCACGAGKVKVAQSCPTLCDRMDYSLPGSSIHGIFQVRSTGVGCYFLLQGIFLTQGSNLGLPHCRQTLYHLSQRLPFFPLNEEAKHRLPSLLLLFVFSYSRYVVPHTHSFIQYIPQNFLFISLFC